MLSDWNYFNKPNELVLTFRLSALKNVWLTRTWSLHSTCLELRSSGGRRIISFISTCLSRSCLIMPSIATSWEFLNAVTENMRLLVERLGLWPLAHRITRQSGTAWSWSDRFMTENCKPWTVFLDSWSCTGNLSIVHLSPPHLGRDSGCPCSLNMLRGMVTQSNLKLISLRSWRIDTLWMGRYSCLPAGSWSWAWV